MSIPVLRFAPSPTGTLHLGSALSALLAHDAAARLGGRFLLRIEDTDVTRCRPAYEAAILDELAWLGLGWEEPVRRQSEHFADYRSTAARLAELGLLYPCTCSRSQIAAAVAALDTPGRPWPRDPGGTPLYPGTCRPGEPVGVDIALAEDGIRAHGTHALRLDMARAVELAGALDWAEFGDAFYTPGFNVASSGARVPADPARWGDVVLCRKETQTSYHLSVVCDDALQGGAGFQRGAELHTLRGAEQLDGDDPRQIVVHPRQPAGAVGGHGHLVGVVALLPRLLTGLDGPHAGFVTA